MSKYDTQIPGFTPIDHGGQLPGRMWWGGCDHCDAITWLQEVGDGIPLWQVSHDIGSCEWYRRYDARRTLRAAGIDPDEFAARHKAKRRQQRAARRRNRGS